MFLANSKSLLEEEEEEEEEQPRFRHQKSKRRRISTPVLDFAVANNPYISEWVGKLPDSFPADMTPRHRLAEKKSSASLRRKRSDSSSSTTSVVPSDQKSRDGKSAIYAQKGYQMLLKIAGVLLESELPVSDDSEIFVKAFSRRSAAFQKTLFLATTAIAKRSKICKRGMSHG
ncbi:uncharacterized protein BCR38DRAFT_507200 [Pseudomassariella vexata]|uniref:Uncharacterized protein n=1 Tax=Pseudomassariella vexata TaxID=1141098 RepID=A0A1Y2E9Z2_9PEZI|nr:uncharacterized protein BCR38DRAFT_507200 [Pseudomassariella vexata]ORY68400.1 hypothetical protein BCR38DRAFT_507200 [Pseudomassariella vexata]